MSTLNIKKASSVPSIRLPPSPRNILLVLPNTLWKKKGMNAPIAIRASANVRAAVAVYPVNKVDGIHYSNSCN